MLIRPIWDWNQHSIDDKYTYNQMLIRPIWDWNNLDGTHGARYKYYVNQTNLGLKWLLNTRPSDSKKMLIRPIWDWNGRILGFLSPGNNNVNQTNLGLKSKKGK